MVETCVLRRQLYYTNFHWNRFIILIVIEQIPWKVLVVSARCKPNLLLFDQRPYWSTVSGVAKRDEGNKTMKTVAHSNKNEQPHTYYRNEAGTRPRTTIAHPHRSTQPRWAHHAVHGSVWQFATFRFDEIEFKLYHFRSISFWMFDFLYQPNMLTRLPPWGIPRVNLV